MFRGPVRRMWRYLRWRNNAKAGRPSALSAYHFKRLGVRVPAVVVSPWIEQHTIVPKTFDHSSIPATLRRVFAPDQKALTNRDAAAASFHDVVTGSTLPRPRPEAGGPNPHYLTPLPDLSTLELPEPPPARTARGGDPAERSTLDEGLDDLAAMVERELGRRPTAAALRRGLPVPRRRGPAATEAEDLFAATARGARRRGRS